MRDGRRRMWLWMWRRLGAGAMQRAGDGVLAVFRLRFPRRARRVNGSRGAWRLAASGTHTHPVTCGYLHTHSRAAHAGHDEGDGSAR